MITAVMIAYNNAPFVEEAVKSALVQDPPFDEVIIVDDCSTDETPRILQDIAAQEPSLRVIRHEHNKGPGAARNTGIAEVRSDYFVFLGGDDRSLTTALRNCIRSLAPMTLISGFWPVSRFVTVRARLGEVEESLRASSQHLPRKSRLWRGPRFHGTSSTARNLSGITRSGFPMGGTKISPGASSVF